MKRQTQFSLILITLISICMLISFSIQHFRNEVDDPLMFLILGSAPSFFYTLGMILLCFWLVNKKRLQSCFYVFVGSLIYEFSQLINFERATFDYLDVYAICIAFLLFAFLYTEIRLFTTAKKFVRFEISE